MATADENIEPQDNQPGDNSEKPENPGADPGKPIVETEGSDGGSNDNMEFILDIPLEVSVELGRTKMLVDLLHIRTGEGDFYGGIQPVILLSAGLQNFQASLQ